MPQEHIDRGAGTRRHRCCGAIGTRRYRPTVAAVCHKLSGAGTQRHYIDATGTRRQRFTLPLQACV